MLSVEFGDVDEDLFVGVSHIGPDILAEQVVDQSAGICPDIRLKPECVCGDGDGFVVDLKSDLSLFEVVNNFVYRQS